MDNGDDSRRLRSHCNRRDDEYSKHIAVNGVNTAVTLHPTTCAHTTMCLSSYIVVCVLKDTRIVLCVLIRVLILICICLYRLVLGTILSFSHTDMYIFSYEYACVYLCQ
jgi:hypothetical protein